MRIPIFIVAVALSGHTAAAQQQPAEQPPQSQPAQQSQPPSSKQQGQAPTQKPHNPADDNPFPESQSQKAVQPSAAIPAKDAPPADSSSSRTGLDRFDAPRGSDSDSRISNGAGGYILNPVLAAQDDKVGGYYLTQKDYKGAYDRYKEATRVNPADAAAVFGLAEAARGLHLDKEAAENYRIYLDALPDGPKSKAARKALAGLPANAAK
jgi:tetratricopeptide (TPR) repeat protein